MAIVGLGRSGSGRAHAQPPWPEIVPSTPGGNQDAREFGPAARAGAERQAQPEQHTAEAGVRRALGRCSEAQIRAALVVLDSIARELVREE